jgi:hypothetical protein
MIIKIQIPVVSSQPHARALVYNKDRSINFMMPLPPAIKKRMGKDKKAYFEATITGDNIELHEKISRWPNW